MHILLIALAQERDAPPGARELARLEGAQALGMARALRDAGGPAPLLVCRRGSELAARAAAEGLEALPVGGAGDLAA
ncbi:MAG: translation initiation factor IF-2, partial [Desulfovibrio sp.]|nr:translation initiation factor IF-2 [Desulfovibrio sp.]